MNDQIESDLRAALRARAAQVPGRPPVRLTGIDYRPAHAPAAAAGGDRRAGERGRRSPARWPW